MLKKIHFLIVFVTIALMCNAQLNTSHVMHTGRSRLYFGNYTGAIEQFNMIIRVQPHLPEPYFYRGAAKLNLDDYRGALADLNKALEIKPFYPDALLYRGMVFYHLGNYKKAMENYSLALEYDSENADIYNNRGICKAAMKDLEGAIDDYTKSIALKPQNYNAYLNRSMAYQIQKEWDKAIDDCNQLIRIRPNSPLGYMSRGLIKVEKKDFAAAIRDFDMAIYLDPNNAYAYQNRGMVKQQLESYQAAIMDYNKAIELNNRLAGAYFNRGIAKEMIGLKGYNLDYKTAETLDPRYSKRPWLTQEEQEQARQQQIQAWYNPQNNDEEKDENIDSQKNDSIPKIDLDELRRRRMIANLAIEDERNMPGNEIENDDKPIQDRIIQIDLEPLFILAPITEKLSENEKFGYFNLTVENLNARYNYQPYLTIDNNLAQNSNANNYYKNQILIFDQLIEQNNTISNNFLYRGVFKMLNKNYNEAIDDFDTAIKLDEHNTLAYFMRANTKAIMIDAIQNTTISNSAEISESNQILSEESYANAPENEAISDIFTDYSVVLYMNPNFAYAYFNRGNIYCRNQKYYEALNEYNRAIDSEPEFAEAYFNRGLVKILLSDIDGAARDLSKAGELGIADSYNIIKRYCNQ